MERPSEIYPNRDFWLENIHMATLLPRPHRLGENRKLFFSFLARTIRNFFSCKQRPVFNNMVCPQGVNFSPLGGMFAPLFTPRGEPSLLFRRMEGQTENFTVQEITSPLADKVHSWGQSLPLGAKLKNGPQAFTKRATHASRHKVGRIRLQHQAVQGKAFHEVKVELV
jgi:hypothetical protein